MSKRQRPIRKSCEGGVAFTPVGRRDDHAKQHSTHPQPGHPLLYDPKRPAAFPNNGRTLTDDVVDVFIPIFTNGKVKGDKVGPHTDLLTNFPYVGSLHKAWSNELVAA